MSVCGPREQASIRTHESPVPGESEAGCWGTRVHIVCKSVVPFSSALPLSCHAHSTAPPTKTERSGPPATRVSRPAAGPAPPTSPGEPVCRRLISFVFWPVGEPIPVAARLSPVQLQSMCWCPFPHVSRCWPWIIAVS